MPSEADACRTWVVPGLRGAGWGDDQIAEQFFFTDGRIVVVGARESRRKRKFADYLLRYRPDLPIAVVEAKAAYKRATDGLGQAKEYADILGLPFAYATNGPEIVEFDRLTGLTGPVAAYPSPDELWARRCAAEGLTAVAATPLLTPDYPTPGKPARYYQRIAINRAVQAIAGGKPRVLLTLATGTGKTTIAFQICWKLYQARWNRAGASRRPRMLFLADRSLLVEEPMTDDFAPFGDARSRINAGNARRGRSMYFATYQALTGDETRGRPLYEGYPPDFFDLIVIDECHRGSARTDSVWREILEWFHPAAQLGMTATPLREETRDTYRYFGGPVYTYSLRDGIDDGFLAPYRVHRVVTDVDAAGWRPSPGDLDRYGWEIPDGEYGTADFERKVALNARTEAIAGHLSRFLDETDATAKTIVFCVDQEHASEMAIALANRNPRLVQLHADYAVRVTADEGEVGRGHLAHFQDVDRTAPVILTTSQLLTTGVDAPTCKNVVLARVVGSMVEFKQIIGRGTRVREEYGKLSFNILDYTGSATRHFADPAFDGDPVAVEEIEIDGDGRVIRQEPLIETPAAEQGEGDGAGTGEERGGYDPGAEEGGPPRKFYFDEGAVEIAAHLVYEIDPDGRVLRMVKLTDYTAEKVRMLVPSAADLRAAWVDPETRRVILEKLGERGLTPETIAAQTGQPEADTFDLLCHLAFNAPLRTRRERAQRLAKEQDAFFARYGPEARQILEELLEKYAVYGVGQLRLPDVLKVPPLSAHGTSTEIAAVFGGTQGLVAAVAELQGLLYAEAEAA